MKVNPKQVCRECGGRMVLQHILPQRRPRPDFHIYKCSQLSYTEGVTGETKPLLAIAKLGASGGFSIENTKPITQIVKRAPLTTRQFVEDHKNLFV
jgi:hypothetical protein